MKVAHLTTVDLSLRFLVLPQLEAVLEAGGEVIGISASGPWVAELEAAGIRHVPLPGSTRSINPLSDLRAAVGLWRILKRERPDVLHTHNPKPGLYGRMIGRLAGVPLVINTVHGLYAAPDDPMLKRGIVYVLEGLASRFSDAELVQSREDLELMGRLGIAGRSKMTYLGNGVDLKWFDPERFDRLDRERVRKELEVEDGRIVVGIVGRLVEEKGYLDLFEASGGLGDEYRVICIGPEDASKADALEPAVIAKAEERGVIFTGMRHDVDELYTAMDLFVLPTHREGFPRAAMEACAMGLPVVATDIRGCREVVEDGVNGFLVPVRDPRALEAAIRKLGEDHDRRRDMGRAARRIAEERFDERKVVETVMATYRRLAREKGLDLGENLEPGEVSIRDGVGSDVAFMAALHMHAISTGFLPGLGRGFMRLLYRALVSDPDAIVLVADDGSGGIGFVSGVPDTGRFYRRFLLRYGLPALLAALPRLVRPSVARKAWETFRYGGGGSPADAELLSMAVVPDARGRGLGTALGARFLELMAERGVDEVKVVVGAENRNAVSAYRRMGFRGETAIEVHAGEPSTELTWKA